MGKECCRAERDSVYSPMIGDFDADALSGNGPYLCISKIISNFTEEF